MMMVHLKTVENASTDNSLAVIARTLLAAVLLVTVSGSNADYKDLAIADAHVHLVDFLQNGDYLHNGKNSREKTKDRASCR